MKNLILCSVLSCLLLACSNESDLETSKNYNKGSKEIKNYLFPLNPANPFDVKGRKYYDEIQLYLKNNSAPNSIEEITNQIIYLSRNYKNNDHHKNSNLGFTAEEILEILNNPSVKLLEIVENCSISTSSKSQLTLFVETLIVQQDEEYETIRDYIISFDAGITENTTLASDEKETILTVSTISSYALYAEAERKDRDWETSVGHKKVQSVFNHNEASIVSVIALLNIITKN